MIADGLNPQEMTYPAELLPEMIIGQRNVKGNYPPWAYATGMLLTPPLNWTLVRLYFAVVSAVALAALGLWSYRIGENFESGTGQLAAASVLAIFAVCVCLSYGQFSLIVVALLVGCFELLRRERMASAGLLLGLAAMKPQLAGLFFLVPAVYPYSLSKKVRFYAAAGGYLLLVSFAVAWLVQSTPWAILHGTTTEAIKFYELSNNRLIIWASQAFGFSAGSKLLAAAVAAVCAALLWSTRRQGDLLVGFSICAILSLYWTYSRHYDYIILSLPLLALLRLAVEERSAFAATAFVLLGALIWAPIRIDLSRTPLVQSTFAIISTFSLATIVVLQKRVVAYSRVRQRFTPNARSTS